MSIPGLGQAAAPSAFAATTLSQTVAVHDLPANSEWRFDVAIGHSIEVKILSGTAEIFGTELAIKHTYTFRGTKSVIFTWHGCKIEVTGACDEFIADETPMVSYVNTHFALDKLREAAKLEGREGPRVLVLGPNNSGKTSLVKLLTAYAIRMGWQPMVVNTDSREGMLSIPGSLIATPFATILDVEQGWGSSPTSTSSPVPVKLPLCYYYGLPSPEDNTKLYKPVIRRLALAATSRLSADPVVRETGMLIDTPGVLSQGKGNYDLTSHIVSEFSVNTILVFGSSRLHSDLIRRFASFRTSNNEPINIVKLDKSDGCVDRDEALMQRTRELSIKEYFFGDSKTTLSPHTQQVSFDEIIIYKVRQADDMASSFMPGGAEENADSSLFEFAEPNPLMSNCILTVMYASLSDSQDTIRDASVMGYVYVADIDEKKRRMKILAPMATRITDRPMIWGSWPEPTMSLIG